MTKTLDEFQGKFLVKEFEIMANQGWIWSLRPSQSTLGAGILSMQRFVPNWSDMTESEALDLRKMLLMLENTLARAFKYDRINYLMLMMVDPHVHFHVLPRYSRSINFAEREWQDKEWPGPPSIVDVSVNIQILKVISDHLKYNIIS